MNYAKILLAIIACLPIAKASADAESVVLSRLAEAKLEPGYDEVSKRFVIIGTADKRLPHLNTNALYDRSRNDLAKRAILDAKRELMYMLSLRVSAADENVMKYEKGVSINKMSSVILQFAKQRLSGCKILCSAESYDETDSNYQVAVVLGWSERVAKSAVSFSMSEQIDNDEGQFKKWCSQNDFSTMLGSRDFVMADGVRRYVGIGFSDVEGLSGSALVMAMRKATVESVGNLAFALKSDLVAQDVAKRMCLEVNFGQVEGRVLWDRFSSQVMSKSTFQGLKAPEVYHGNVVNPLTGHQMYVVVRGVSQREVTNEKK